MSELDDKMLAVGALRKVAMPFVSVMDDPDHATTANPVKHDWVYNILLALIPFLKGSVKELRSVPDEVLAEAADQAVTGAVAVVRKATS